MANFFDQFDEKVKEGGNFFDQFDERPKKKEEGVGTALRRGAEQLVSTGQTALETVTKGGEEAARRSLERQADIQARLGEGASLERLLETYRQQGLLAAGKELAGQIPTAIAEQVPNIAATLGGAGAGALAAGPVGAVIGAAAPSLIQQFGGNIQRQAAEQVAAGKPLEIETGTAAAAAVPQAALDVAATFIPLGGKIVSRMFGPEFGQMLMKSTAEGREQLVKETFLPSIKQMGLGTAIKGTAVGIAAEVPTEVAQSMIERAQAGLKVLDDDALKEYGETAFAASLLGPIGIIGRVSNKAEAGRQLAEAQRIAQEKNETQQIEIKTAEEPTVLYVSPTGDVAQSIEQLDEITKIKQAQAAAQPSITEATTTPEADQRAIQERMVAGFSQRPEIQKIEARYQATMAERDKEQVAKSAFNTIVTPDVIKRFGVGPTASIFKDTDLINADISNPNVADQVRARLEAFAQKSTSPKIKKNIEQYLDRVEFLTPKSINEILSQPQEIPKGAENLQQFAFIDKDGKVKSVIGNIVKKGNKQYIKYPKGERELTNDVVVNPNPDQIELLKLYKARDNELKSKDEFKEWLQRYGVASSERADIGLEKKYVSTYFRKNGYGLDELVRAAINDGILTEADFDFAGSVGGVESMREYIRRAMSDEFVPTTNNIIRETNLRRIDDRIAQLEEQQKGAAEEDIAAEVIDAQELRENQELEQYSKSVAGESSAMAHAKDLAGQVVFEQGDLGLIRGFNALGRPVYIPTKGTQRARVDVDSFTGTLIDPESLKMLKQYKQEYERREEEKHASNPFIKWDANGNAFSESITSEIRQIFQEWKKILGLKQQIYVTTIPDATANINNFTGPHRAVASVGLTPNLGGGTRRMADGSRYIALKPTTSKSKLLETLAHEMGHAHEMEVFETASPEVQKQIKDEHMKWLQSQTGKSARELVNSLRARTSAKTTKIVNPALEARQLDPYWRSFGEWYADQVSRWAVTAEKPVSVVEKFFKKLADALRRFYQTIRGQGFLPNETFKQYLEAANSKESFERSPMQPISDKDQIEMFARTTADKVRAPLTGVDPAYADKLLKQFTAEKATVKQRFEGLKENFFERMVIGLFDEFKTIKKYSDEAYMMARMSKSIDGGLQGLLEHGEVFNDGGALNIRPGTKGLLKILEPLGTEVDQYQMWKALNRDANLPADKRSFDQELLSGRDQLAKGELNGKSRRAIYEQALKEEQALNRSVLKVALDAGIIDKAGYDRFASDIYYIPFYKMMEDGDVQSISAASKLTGQEFSKALKGGPKKVNDLMENVLMNWSHILSAAMKNQAANRTLEAAEAMGAARVARPVDGKYPPNSVKVMRDGKPVRIEIDDAGLVDAISTISYLGPKSMFLDVAREFTNALRYGVTLSPAYKLRNLIRDSISSAAVSPLSKNLYQNVYNGLKMSDKGNPTYMAALASGGIFEMGVAHEGNQAKLIKRLVDKGVDIGTILDTPDKIKGKLQDALDWYNQQGNRFENANRLALYDKLIREGKTHLEASFQARDLMDFSMQGQFRAVKVISTVVPFFNARLQGLYKLGRDGISPTSRLIYNTVTGKPVEASDRQKGQRFMAISGAVMLASMLLYGMYKDDEDFRRREDWDRDNFWWFKIGDTAFRIPKPFEIGALGTLAERTYEQIADDGVEGKVFFKRFNSMLMDTFSLNPIPQMIKPMIDLYANKDSFTGAPIESAGMERLSAQERVTDKTSGVAKALGGISAGMHKVLSFNPDAQGFSPIQVDYAIKAYLGWAGSTAAATADLAVEPFTEGTKVRKPVIDTLAMGFIKTEPETASKFMSEFYETNARVQSALADMRHYAELGDSEKVGKILKEQGDDIAIAKLYDKTTKQLAEIRKQMRLIEQSKDIDTEDKRAEMNRLRILMSKITENVEQARKSMKQ